MSYSVSNDVEVITDGRRYRYWSYDEKLRIVEESLAPGETVSRVARRNGVRPNLLYRWRRLLSPRDAQRDGTLYKNAAISSSAR